MADIRLNKLCRQFNVGLQPLVDFLNYMGAQVECNPNCKVSDEFLPAIQERFGRDQELSKAADATLIRLKDIIGDTGETERVEKSAKVQEQRVPASQADLRVVGRVDLSQFDPKQVKKRERIKVPVVKKFDPKLVEGTIITIKPQHYIIDVGLPIFAFIPPSEFRDYPNLKKGAVVPILIEDPGTISGHVKASFIKGRENKIWSKIEKAFENADVISGYVKYKKASGFAVDVFSHEAFLPYSLVELKPITQYDVYLNREVKVKIVELDREKNRIILSRKDVLRQEEESRPKYLIQEIWKEHLNLQQKQLDLKKRPIKVDRSSSKLFANTLQLTLDKRSSVDGFVELVQSKYGLEESCFSEQDGFNVITIPASNEMSLNSDLVNKASAASIQLTSNPSIYGTLSSNDQVLTDLFEEMGADNQLDSSGRSQVTLDVLARLQEYYSALQHPISLPDTASIILRCEPNLEYVLRTEFPGVMMRSRFVRKQDRRDEQNGVFFEPRLTLFNHFFYGEDADKLQERFGLKLRLMTLSFFINPAVIGTTPIPDNLDYDKKYHRLLFKVPANHLMEDAEEEGYDLKSNINFFFTARKRIVDRLFGKENVKYEVCFDYAYSPEALGRYFAEVGYDRISFLNEACQYFNGTASCNYSQQRLGIDFEWKGKDLYDVIEEFYRQCPIASFSYYDNHRVNIMLPQVSNGIAIDFDAVKQVIQEDFPSIHLYDLPGKRLLFIQEYNEPGHLELFHSALERELSILSERFSIETSLSEYDPEVHQYVYFLDENAEEEENTESIAQLRGFDFFAGSIPIGKLYRVQLPDLFFDCSEVDLEEIRTLVDKEAISSIVPDLAGEEEKLFRLTGVMNKLSSGEGLVNPALSEVMFSVQKAMPITNLASEYPVYYQKIKENLINKRINDSQIEAIIKTLLAKDISIIQGPPGTGKSTAIAEMIWQHIALNGAEKILVTSETNIAVDNALSKILNSYNNIVKPIRIGDTDSMESEGSQFALSTLNQWVEKTATSKVSDDADSEENEDKSDDVVLQNWLNNISRRSQERGELPQELAARWSHFLEDPDYSLRRIAYKAYVGNCNVIGATCSSIGENNRKGRPTSFFKQYKDVFPRDKQILFDVVLQDESSKATPAELSLPLIYGKKNILIGDHRQLPPMIDKDEFIMSMDVLESDARGAKQKTKITELRRFIEKHFGEMERSHFERLFLGADPSIRGTFNTQYRMHPDINDVIRQFYVEDGGLECGLPESQVNDPDMTNPMSRYHGIKVPGLIDEDTHVLWIDSDSPELKSGTSRVNYGEIDIIGKILESLSKSPSYAEYLQKWESPIDKQIGIISFYGKQVRLLRDLCRSHRDIPTRVSTVDRFQGMERNIVIVSMVRSDIIAETKEQRPDHRLFGAAGYPKQNSLGFAQSPNRLNVALSRAKRLLIIVGNSRLFRQKDIYDNAYKAIEGNPHSRIVKQNELA